MFPLWGCKVGQGSPLLVDVSLGPGSDSFCLCLDDGSCIQCNWKWLLGVQRNELYSLFDDLRPCSLLYCDFPSQKLIQLQSFIAFWCDMVFPSISLCCCCGCWWSWCGCNYCCRCCNGLFDDFVESDHFVLFLCSRNLPPTKKELIAVFYWGSTMLVFVVIAQFLLDGLHFFITLCLSTSLWSCVWGVALIWHCARGCFVRMLGAW